MLTVLKRWMSPRTRVPATVVALAPSPAPISSAKRADEALAKALQGTRSWDALLDLLGREFLRQPESAALAQLLAELQGACGDFAVAQRLHEEAKRSDPSLARSLSVPSYSTWAQPTVLCAISNICNINCRICETQDSVVRKGNMDFELVRSIIDQCKARGISTIILHHVNEPLLHPSIFDILLYLEDRGIDAVISTNANEMKSVLRRAQKLPRLPLTWRIRYSIDAGRRDTYNEIRRGGDFDKVVEGVRLLRNFCADRGIELETSSNYVMTRKSVRELVDFVDTFQEFIPTNQMYFSVVNGNTPTGLNQYIIDNRLTDFVRRTPCYVPFQQLNILRDGRVSLCCVDFNEEAIVGDVRKQSIDEIWNGSPELARHRAALGAQDVENMHPICKRCYMATAAYADAGINRGIQQMFGLKAAGVPVTNEQIYSRIRFELMMHGLDVAELSEPVRLFSTGDDFVTAHSGG
jgi:MoaA/NifB/PqqE/SkfB family radical SAM enzyme